MRRVLTRQQRPTPDYHGTSPSFAPCGRAGLWFTMNPADSALYAALLCNAWESAQKLPHPGAISMALETQKLQPPSEGGSTPSAINRSTATCVVGSQPSLSIIGT